MRQIGSLSTRQEAQRFTAYLVKSGVEAMAEQDGDQWAVWVRDENQVQQARQSLDAFRENPDDPRYVGAEREAEAIRRKQRQEQREAQKNFIDVRRRWQQPTARDAPLTITMIALSVVVTLVSGFGGRPDQRVAPQDQQIGVTVSRQLSFVTVRSFKQTEGNPLADVAKGQLWRLVTPVFIHLNWIHLIFNMLWFYQFGTLVEKLRGSWRLALLILATAVIPNLAQAVAPQQWGGNPFFGGMSGVLYGLFGYIWLRSIFSPASGFFMPRVTVIILIGWLFLCMTPAISGVANVAHVVGLVVGMSIGYIPTLWTR